MASDPHTTGAPARAPAFPDLDFLEDAGAILSSVDGALSILAVALEGNEYVGVDASNAAYAAGYAVIAAREKVDRFVTDLMKFRSAAGGQ